MWKLSDSLEAFEISGNPPARSPHALRIDGTALLLREPVAASGYDLALEVAFAGQQGFAGLVFGARDARWHELVYLSPGGEVQYDPVMNGSNTWQVYPELRGRAAVAAAPGQWVRMRVQVRPEGFAAHVGDALALVVRPLRAGAAAGRAGVWGYLPADVRNLEVTASGAPLPPSAPAGRPPLDAVAIWRLPSGVQVPVEANGVLNLNRHLAYREGGEAEVHAEIAAPGAGPAVLSLGYSDRLRLWLNGTCIHEGLNRWAPPRTDGRILPPQVEVPVMLRSGTNELVARVGVDEPFGWGVAARVRAVGR
jgi:hypothetical protein